MHDSVDSPVHQAVFGLEASYPEGTRGVMPPTAAISSGKASQLGVFSCRIAFAAPFCARYAEYIRQVAATPEKEFLKSSTRRHKNCFRLGENVKQFIVDEAARLNETLHYNYTTSCKNQIF